MSKKGLQDIRNFFSPKPRNIAPEARNIAPEYSGAGSSSSISAPTPPPRAESRETTPDIELEGLYLSEEELEEASEEAEEITQEEAIQRPIRLPAKYRNAPLSENDIALYTNRRLKDDEKTKIMNCWVPPAKYRCPPVKQGKYNRNFQPKWLSDNQLMAFSHIELGIYCKVCVAWAYGRTEQGKGEI